MKKLFKRFPMTLKRREIRATRLFWARKEEGVHKISKERFVVMPEGYGYGISKTQVDGKSIRKRIGVKTEKTKNFLSNFKAERYTVKTYNSKNELIGTSERVAMKLKSGRASDLYYTVSDDHTKKVRGLGKGIAKVQNQKETENAYSINLKSGSRYEFQQLQQAWEAFGTEMTYRSFDSKIRLTNKKGDNFRKRVLQQTGFDFGYLKNIKKKKS